MRTNLSHLPSAEVNMYRYIRRQTTRQYHTSRRLGLYGAQRSALLGIRKVQRLSEVVGARGVAGRGPASVAAAAGPNSFGPSLPEGASRASTAWLSPPAAGGPAPHVTLSDWSEEAAWEGALQAASGSDPAALAALRRDLMGLRTLLPDLQPVWRQQLDLQQNLARVEARLRGVAVPPGDGADGTEDTGEPATPPAPETTRAAADAAPSPQTPPFPPPPPIPAPPPEDVCMYSATQTAAGELQGLAGDVRQLCNPATSSAYQHSMWVLTEVLMGAATCYPGTTRFSNTTTSSDSSSSSSGGVSRGMSHGLGPAGSTQDPTPVHPPPPPSPHQAQRSPPVLLRRSEAALAAAAVQVARRSHEAHLVALVQVQVRLASQLPEVSRRLVRLRTEIEDPDIDVGRLVVTHLGLLADL